MTRVDGLNTQTVQTIISEVDVDMSRWLQKSSFRPGWECAPTIGSAAVKFLSAAPAKSSIGQQPRCVWRRGVSSEAKARSGRTFADCGPSWVHRKRSRRQPTNWARLIYRMLKFGVDYVDKGIEAYESRYRQQQMKWLTKQAAALNLQLVPSSEITG
jgi:transposase